jgi:hypothetical protein
MPLQHQLPERQKESPQHTDPDGAHTVAQQIWGSGQGPTGQSPSKRVRTGNQLEPLERDSENFVLKLGKWPRSTCKSPDCISVGVLLPTTPAVVCLRRTETARRRKERANGGSICGGSRILFRVGIRDEC